MTSARYNLRRLLPALGYQQWVAVMVAVVVIVFFPGMPRLIFAIFLTVGVLVRVLDNGYVDLGPTHLTVRSFFYLRVRYVDIEAIERYQPRWEGWFGRLNRNLTRIFEKVHSPEFIAANWPDSC